MIWDGANELKKACVEITSLSPDPENLNHHPEYSYQVLMKSLSRFGQHKPIVVHKGVVICGNGLFEAANRLGWSHVAISTFEGTDREAKALAIADNKSKDHSHFVDDLPNVLEDLLKDFSAEELGGFADLDIEDPFGVESFDDEPEDEPEEEKEFDQKTIRVTAEQWETISAACDKIREIAASSLPEGRCIELICADYLAG